MLNRLSGIKMRPPIIGIRVKIGLQTRGQNDIVNEMCTIPPDDGMLLEANSYKQRFPDADHRPTKPSQFYNCHGLTFGSRRTRIWLASEIQKILKEDGYSEVSLGDVSAGDIITYTDAKNELIHSGIVVRSDEMPGLGIKDIRVLSKWGHAHEVIHKPSYCPYPNAIIKYHRVNQ